MCYLKSIAKENVQTELVQNFKTGYRNGQSHTDENASDMTAVVTPRGPLKWSYGSFQFKTVPCLEMLVLKPCCVLTCICSVYFSVNFYQISKPQEFIAERKLTFMKIPPLHFGGTGDHMHTPHILIVPDTNASY